MSKIRKITDVISYFKSKGEIEIEKKALNKNLSEIENRLLELDAIQVFNGIVISEYYYGKPSELFNSPYFRFQNLSGLVEKEVCWARLRIMKDEDGMTIGSAETKIQTNDISKTNVGIDGIKDLSIIQYLQSDYGSRSGVTLREIEMKKRKIFVLPDGGEGYLKGIEYSLDTIFEYERNGIVYKSHIPSFLEIEGREDRDFKLGMAYLNKDIEIINEEELVKESCKDLIRMDWEKYYKDKN